VLSPAAILLCCAALQALNDLVIICDTPALRTWVAVDNGGARGKWSADAICPAGSFASSLATRVQEPQGTKDDGKFDLLFAAVYMLSL